MCKMDFRIKTVVGPMFAGKTTELISAVESSTVAGQKYQVFKHGIDNRYSRNKVVSHIGASVDAIIVSDKEGFRRSLDDDTEIVFIDEVQFFGEWIVEEIVRLASTGRKIFCSGLDMDYRGKPFGIIGDILAISDVVVKKSGVCARCHGNSAFSHLTRKTDIDGNILVGGNDSYEPLCWECFWKARNEETGGV